MIRQRPNILGNDTITSDSFGSSTAMSGDGSLLVSGASEHNQTGAVYVFSLGGDSLYSQIQKIVSDDIATGDNFGISVDISKDGSVIVVGASGTTIAGKSNFGCAYVFRKSGNSWIQEAKLFTSLLSTTTSQPFFGSNVAISGDGNTIVVSNKSETKDVQYALCFYYDGVSWTEKFLPYSEPAEVYNTEYNWKVSVDFNGEFIVSSKALAQNGTEDNVGSVFVYKKNEGSYQNFQTLNISRETFPNIFSMGTSLYFTENGLSVLASAPKSNLDEFSELGAICVFNRHRRDLTFSSSPEVFYPRNTDQVDNLRFGLKISCSENAENLIISCNGSAYLYNRSPKLSSWEFMNLILASDYGISEVDFASDVVCSKDFMFFSIASKNHLSKGVVTPFKVQYRIFLNDFTRLGSLTKIFDTSIVQNEFSNPTGFIELRQPSQSAVFQKLTINSLSSFNKLKLKLNKIGTPTGLIAVRIIRESGVLPSTSENNVYVSWFVDSEELTEGENEVVLDFPVRLSSGNFYIQIEPYSYDSWSEGLNEVAVAVVINSSSPDILLYDSGLQNYSAVTSTSLVYSLELSSSVYRGQFNFLNFPVLDTSNPHIVLTKQEPFNYFGGELLAFDIDGNIKSFTLAQPAIAGAATASELASSLNIDLASIGGQAEVVNGRVKISSTTENGYAKFFHTFNTVSQIGTGSSMDIFKFQKGYFCKNWKPDILSRARVSVPFNKQVVSAWKFADIPEFYANSTISNYLDDETLSVGEAQSIKVEVYDSNEWSWTKQQIVEFGVTNFIEKPFTQIVSNTQNVSIPSSETSHLNVVLFEDTIDGVVHYGAFWYL
jgi:hypothetical protein